MNVNKRLMALGVLLGFLTIQSYASELQQTVTPEISRFGVYPGDAFDIPLQYTASSGETTGLGIALSFDSKKLKFLGFTEKMEEGLVSEDKDSRLETKNRDIDNRTDSMAAIAWMSVNGTWPGEGKLPITLATARFKVLDSGDANTFINISGDAAAKSSFSSIPVNVRIRQGNNLGENASSGGAGSLSWLFAPTFLLIGFFTRFSKMAVSDQ